MIQVFKPKINTEKVLTRLKPILESGWVGLGPKTKEFETKLAEFIGVKHFIALNSATSGLHLAIKVLNLPPKSKILTTPITFISTNHAILYENHTPVFCDVEKTTGNISVDSFKQALKEHKDIKAIIVVHIGGYSCNMDEINTIAKENNVLVIEDCAHAFGGQYNNKKIGDTDNICVWSFQAVKNLPVGDGGAVSTNNDEIYKRLIKLRWLGIDKDTVSRSNLKSDKQTYNWDYNVEEVGYKYHLNDIASLLGLVGLEDIEENNKRRKEIAEFYLNNLTKNIIKPNYDSNRDSSFHFIPFFFEDRDYVYECLKNNNIFCGMHYKRNDKYDMYDSFPKIGNMENTEWFQDHEITLPIHLFLTNDDLQLICDIINNR